MAYEEFSENSGDISLSLFEVFAGVNSCGSLNSPSITNLSSARGDTVSCRFAPCFFSEKFPSAPMFFSVNTVLAIVLSTTFSINILVPLESPVVVAVVIIVQSFDSPLIARDFPTTAR